MGRVASPRACGEGGLSSSALAPSAATPEAKHLNEKPPRNSPPWAKEAKAGEAAARAERGGAPELAWRIDGAPLPASPHLSAPVPSAQSESRRGADDAKARDGSTPDPLWVEQATGAKRDVATFAPTPAPSATVPPRIEVGSPPTRQEGSYLRKGASASAVPKAAEAAASAVSAGVSGSGMVKPGSKVADAAVEVAAEQCVDCHDFRAMLSTTLERMALVCDFCASDIPPRQTYWHCTTCHKTHDFEREGGCDICAPCYLSGQHKSEGPLPTKELLERRGALTLGPSPSPDSTDPHRTPAHLVNQHSSLAARQHQSRLGPSLRTQATAEAHSGAAVRARPQTAVGMRDPNRTTGHTVGGPPGHRQAPAPAQAQRAATMAAYRPGSAPTRGVPGARQPAPSATGMLSSTSPAAGGASKLGWEPMMGGRPSSGAAGAAHRGSAARPASKASPVVPPRSAALLNTLNQVGGAGRVPASGAAANGAAVASRWAAAAPSNNSSLQGIGSRHWPSFLAAEKANTPHRRLEVADAVAAFSPLAAAGGVSAHLPFGAHQRPQSAATPERPAQTAGRFVRPTTAARVR